MICTISSLRPVRVKLGFKKGFFRGRGKGSGVSGDICSQRDYSKPKDEAVTLISDALAIFFCPLDKITFFS